MNYDGNIVFEDDDDESWSALTEDISDGTGTPFSPILFETRQRDSNARTDISEQYEEGLVPTQSTGYQNNTIGSMNDSDAAKIVLSATQLPIPPTMPPPMPPPKQLEFVPREPQDQNNDAVILAQSRQSQNKRLKVVGPRGSVASIKSPEDYERSRRSHYNAIGFAVDNRTRTPGQLLGTMRDERFLGDDPRNSSSMGYLPSRHFQHSVDTKQSSLRSRSTAPTIQVVPLSIQNQEQVYGSGIQSPSNESQITVSTLRSNRSISSARSRRSVVSHHSSTSLSILHGEVINLEGNSLHPKNNASNSRHHLNQHSDPFNRYNSGDQNILQLDLSGMQIGGSTIKSEGRRSGARSFLSSKGFSTIQQDKYQGNGNGRVFTFGLASERILNAQRHASKFGQDAKKGVVKIKGRAASVAKHIMSKYYRPPLSPRSRELKDLEYLKKSHKEKFDHLKIPHGNDKHGNESLSSDFDEDNDENFFDFVIVLTPQESYEYWANLLDFREEYLGLDSSDVWGRELESPGGASTNTTDSRASGEEILSANSGDKEFNHSPQTPDSDEHVGDLSTPLTGLLRRKGMKTPLSKNSPSRRTSRQSLRYIDSHQKSRFSQFSRSNLTSPFAGTPLKRGLNRMSMFERAIQSPTLTSSRSRTFSQHSYYSQSTHTFQSDIRKESGTIAETPVTTFKRPAVSTVRRRWGNPTMPPTAQSTKSFANVLSPPVRSLKRETGSERIQITVSDLGRSNRLGNQEKSIVETKTLKVDSKRGIGEEENENPNVIQSVEDMPNPVIPRGFAVRKNGMMRFLSALRAGIVLRRHCPNKEAIFCKLSSDNGGDTIKYQMIDSEEAMAAFKSQRVRYNRNFKECTSPTSLRANCAEWSCLEEPLDKSSSSNKFVPDHVASQKYREKFNREHGLFKRLYDVAMNEANSGIFDSKDIVALHPATKVDRRHPGIRKEELGTASLRRSLSSYNNDLSFSLVTAAGQPFMKTTSDNLTETWQRGEGSEHLFKTLDFEAATEGEYWLVLRGLLLLYRDAMNKKLNSNGKTGIGGGEPKGIGGGASSGEFRLQQDMYIEPSTVGRLEKLVVKMRKLNDDYIRGAVMPGAVPPPSDYFLGFKSPGTQIWSRLRWAGLETQRVFSADPRRVMIKIRCPEDRLTDVAEVLRLKIKTKDGSYAPFHEDAAHIFQSREDHLDIPSIYRGHMASLLGSRDRQTIIDFIIGSRIRDSGAELAQTTQVGKMIEAKVPLHMRRKLDSLYNSWVLYWRREHWTGIQESDPSISSAIQQSSIEEGDFPGQNDEDKSNEDRRPVPNILTRIFVEAFNQPLDAIEDYFGEKVTFYFAWMQHCSIHLLFLALFGLIVTFCQVITDNFDHWLRPWFSLAVMIWTFVVLVNWKKRSNYLAYRWGSMDHTERETNRPEFDGKYMRDPITDEWVIKYPRWKRWLKYMISIPISVFFTCLALFLILLVHANRDMQMAKYIEARTNSTSGVEDFEFVFSWKNIGEKQLVGVEVSKDLLLDPTYWIIMATLPSLLGLAIPILNIILMNLSVALNNFENYQTDAQYRTHLIMKVFSFRFVSQFGTVYYYAFISAAINEKEAFENGMIRMGTSLLIYTTVAHWWNIFLQVYVFMGIRNIRHYLYRKRLRKELKNIELLEEEYLTNERCDAEVREISLINKRILLDQAQDDLWMEIMCPPHDSFPEYITAVVQFSFVACFSVILPCVPFLVLINYLLSMRFDAYKVCKGRRRPLAKRTGGIGVWEHLLHIVAVIAVLTNCWLVAFFHPGCREILNQVGPTATVFLIVAWEHIMLLIKYLMSNTISSLPKEIRDEIKQKQHQSEKKRYENMRLKTEQTRRLKRERASPGSFRLQSVAPDSISRGGSSVARHENKNIDNDLAHSHSATPQNGGRLQMIESFEESNRSRSIANNRHDELDNSMSFTGSSFIHDESRILNGDFSVSRITNSVIGGHLQTIESFEGSLDDYPSANNERETLHDSKPRVQEAPIDNESRDENDVLLFNEESDEFSALNSKPGELFEC